MSVCHVHNALLVGAHARACVSRVCVWVCAQVHDAMQAGALQVARGENAHAAVTEAVRRVLQARARACV